MRILIADDHPMVRDALARTLAGLEPAPSVAVAVDRDSLLAMAGDAPFDLALIDLNMPGMDGMDGLHGLRRLHPSLPVIVVSGQNDAATTRAVLDAGAAGFVPKTESADMLLDAVRTVHAGQVFVPPQVVRALLDDAAERRDRPAAPLLTPRQRDVMRLLLQGEPNKLIARRLGLTEGTVKLHIAALLRALQVRNRTEAVVRAREFGLDLP